ncbi:5-carboxymethyl-2-hydroxymuconate Delta-isomerase [Thalassotalea maritima]|uniref:5-carboxymethyl-2-hydroxymuconate Delta-isomerase n=1 Tax=Thalassotalea maritima TaxID=3242416 RepID=UPI0035283A13
MPHFIIHCSDDILQSMPQSEFNQHVYSVAAHSGLFVSGDIKVRVQAFSTYLVGEQQQSFIHVFASIMQGRTVEQRAALSRAVVTKLTSLFPDTPNIAMNVDEFEKATYCNKAMLG